MAWRSGGAVRVVALVLALALTGCATKIRNVPNQALSNQPVKLVERDQRECEQAITGKVKGVWFPAELEFASCMMARNYRVYVQVLDASVEVKKASPRARMSAARILTDLVICEDVVEKKVSMAEKIARPSATVVGFFFWPVTVGSMVAAARLPLLRQQDYTACMQPRGYVVTVWQPGDDERPVKSLERTAP
jgi:hypothetical protein